MDGAAEPGRGTQGLNTLSETLYIASVIGRRTQTINRISVSLVRLLGVVQDISHDGRLIVKARFAPELREQVRDNVNTEIGRVAKVFGPVRSPFVAITPREEHKTLAVLGKEVYVQGEREHGKGKRRG